MNEPGYERVDRDDRKRTLHAFGCVVDGGTERHGRHFRCPRCAELSDSDETERLLVRIDRLAPLSL